MQAGGYIAGIFLIVFVLYMIYSVETAQPAEREMQWFAVICPKVGVVPCVEKKMRIPRSTTAFECFQYGGMKLVETMKQYPNWKVKKWGCRPEGLSV